MENTEDKSIIQADYELNQLARHYNDLKAHRDLVLKGIEDTKLKILIAMRSAMKAVDDNGEVIISRNSKSRYFVDQKRLQEELPDVYLKYMKVTDFEEIRIKGDI